MSEPYQGTQIVHLTDTTDRNAQLKIRGAYALHKGRLGIHGDVDVVAATNTLLVGTTASELITNTQRPDRLIIAVNVAPPDKKDGTKDNARRNFYVADLGDGVTVGGTVTGLEFSYIRPLIKDFYELTTTNSKGSQFRSLEILPEAVLGFSDTKRRGELIADGTLKKVENIDAIVPAVPNRTHVLEVDNFNNVKLWITQRDKAALAAAAEAKKDVRVTFAEYSVELLAAKTIEKQAPDPKHVLTPFGALATPTLFEPPLGTNLVALRSSSRRADGEVVPIIATMREFPAETKPNYPVPRVGAAVELGFGSPR